MEAEQRPDKSFLMGSDDGSTTPASTVSLDCQESSHMGNSERSSFPFEGGNYEGFVFNDISVSNTRMNSNGNGNYLYQRPVRACTSPISSIVGTALHQLNLKRSSSAPMINQMGTATETPLVKSGTGGGSGNKFVSTVSSSTVSESPGGNKEPIEREHLSLATTFLASFNNGGPRPRRFSASFSPGSPNPAPNRVNQLKHENTTDWEAVSEKEFHGTSNIAQSWEDLSLDSMSMEIVTRRPSLSETLYLSMPPASSNSVSASSSPAASPRVLSRFSPSLSSPSPTRKSFTTRRSLSPIAVRPSVLSIGQGVKRKVDWDAGTSPMDCSPQPAKRSGGLLGFQCSNSSYPTTPVNNHHSLYSASSFHANSSAASAVAMITNHVEDSPNSFETESSVSSNGGRDSPFFRPVDSPIPVLVSPDDSHQSTTPKI